MKQQTELFNLEQYTNRTTVGDWQQDVGEGEVDYVEEKRDRTSQTHDQDDSLTPPKSVSESCERINVSESPPKPFSIHTYYPAGKARGGSCYYRITWRDGKRVRHLHIPGGAADSPVIQKRLAQIQRAHQAGMSREEIVSMVQGWKGKKRTRRNRP